MVGVTPVESQQRAIFRDAARMMRRILVDAARAGRAQTRRSGSSVDFDAAAIVSPQPTAPCSPRRRPCRLRENRAAQAKVVELRYFGGLNEEEIVEVLQVSPRTVRRDWDSPRLARPGTAFFNPPRVVGSFKSQS